MHEEPADKLRPGNRKRFPASAIFIVFNRKGDRVFIHTDDPVVADSDPVGVFPKVTDPGTQIFRVCGKFVKGAGSSMIEGIGSLLVKRAVASGSSRKLRIPDRTVGSLWSIRIWGTLTSSQRICRTFLSAVF